MDYTKFRLRSFTSLEHTYIMDCGSAYELPLKYCNSELTDTDHILYYYDICAIPWNRNPPKNTKCTILRIDSTETPSGYARLKMHRNGQRDNSPYYRRPLKLADVESGGPSIGSVKALFNLTQGCHRDQVLAIYCPYWPVEAEEWRVRKRFHGWPNEKLIARITRGGCHLVSKLRTWSSCDDTEWRFSFSKAELLLIHSWTDVQKMVYHIIRRIKNFLIIEYGCDGSRCLQTYYFKTLMFWACEELPPEFWNEQNIISCVEAVLLRFLGCLEKKFCPSYFIPDCNVMCHLKDEERFQDELQALQELLVSENMNYACGRLMRYTKSKFLSMTGSFEYLCSETMAASLPINEGLNGRFPQYLSECEWFLPGMKDLHSAIEAHLRLMYLDNVASRKESKDCVECLEKFKCALIRNEDFESLRYSDLKMSFYENFNAILRRKQSKNSIPVYRRGHRMCDEFFHQMVKESHPSILLRIVSAYRANFYFTALQSYKESLTECSTCLDVFDNSRFIIVNGCPEELRTRIPVLICNSLSQIYDENLTVILGFATLHRNISSSNSSNSSTAHEVCLKLDAKAFLKYLCLQCEKNLAERNVIGTFTNFDYDQPFMSQVNSIDVFSSAILFAALRQIRQSWVKTLTATQFLCQPRPLSTRVYDFLGFPMTLPNACMNA